MEVNPVMAFASPRGTPRDPRPLESPRQAAAYQRPSLNGYTEEEMVAEARCRIEHNKQRRVMKQILQEKAPVGSAVKTKDLMLAAKIAGMQVPPEIVADTRHAAMVDQVGAPTHIKWRPFMQQDMPPPALHGHGGFGELPPLKKNSRRNSAETLEAAAPDVAPQATVKFKPQAKDKEVTYWFNMLVSKIKDRFTEVRRAYRILDDDCDGFLDKNEFKKLLGMFNLESMPDAVFDRIVQLIDGNGDGTVTFAEFAKLVDTPNAIEAFKAQGR